MCLILIAYQVHPGFPLVVLANRDEFLARPARPMQWWPERPGVLAGKDLQAGGTWMGMSRSGRFAALTNHRDLTIPQRVGRSRGHLVLDALERDVQVDLKMAGYNLISGPWNELRYQDNLRGTDRALEPGIHGLSNAFLDTPWPKLLRTRDAFTEVLHAATPDDAALFRLMLDEGQAPDLMLPKTGVPLEVERALSAPFIRMDGYGTRCTTLLMVDRRGRVRMEERTYPASDGAVFEWSLEG